MEVPKKKRRRELTYDPAIPLLGIYLEKTRIRKDAPQCSLQHLLQHPRHRSNLNVQRVKAEGQEADRG